MSDERVDALQHQFWHGPTIQAREQHRMQVNIDRISLIVRGLLEVDAVGMHLSNSCSARISQPSSSPTPGIAKFREHRAGVPEPERLAGEVRIGTEVRRQVSLDVRRVARADT